MNFKKSKEITEKTRKKVYLRQHGLSISKRCLPPGQTEYHHFIERSSSGVGFEWNVVALTSEEHRQLHDGQKVGRFSNHDFKTLIRNHLILNYEGWSEEKCKYKRGFEEDEYGVVRRNID